MLLDNYATGFGLDANTGNQIYPENCQILRKNRVTGELLIVFESDSDGYEFCNGAKISADGNLVAAAPAGPTGNSESVSIELENGDLACDYGEVTVLLVCDLATGTNTAVTDNWMQNYDRFNPDPRIPFSPVFHCPTGTIRYPGQSIHSLTSAGDFALLYRYGISERSGLTQTIFELVDITAGIVEPVTLNTDEGNYVFIRSIALSEDGMRIAVNAQLSAGRESPSSFPPCSQTGRCDPSGELPPQDGCNSWWICPVPAEPPTNNIYIIDRISGAQTLPEALSNLPAGTLLHANAWSTDGNQLSWIETPKMPVG